MKTRGQLISDARARRGLTYARLGELVGCNASNLHHVENGAHGGSATLLARIEDILGLEPGCLARAPVTAPARSPSPCSGDSGSEPSNQPAP